MIKKLPDGRWESRTDTYDPLTGKRRQLRRRFPTKGAAQEYERSLLLSGPAAPARNVPSFSSYAASWLEAKRTTGSVAPSTISSYGGILKILGSVCGDVPISRFTPSRIEAILARLLETRKPSTVRVYFNHLKEICDRAVRDGYLTANPCARILKPRGSSGEIIPPDAARIRDLLADHEGDDYYLPLLLMALTGMRISEVLGLAWDCVDLVHGTLTVRRQRCRQALYPDAPPVPGTNTVLIEHTKTRHIRTISIPQVLIDALAAARKDRLARGVVSPLVCLNRRNVAVNYSSVYHAAHGLMRLHDLRHAHATLLIDSGIPITEVSRRLGHVSFPAHHLPLIYRHRTIPYSSP